MSLSRLTKIIFASNQRFLRFPDGAKKISTQRILFASQQGPFNSQDVERFRQAFRTMPSFNEKDNSIDAKDIPVLCKAANYDRTPEQTNSYIEYHNKVFGGKLYMENMAKMLSQAHNTPEVTRIAVELCDQNGDGFIQSDEYKLILKAALAHDPTVPQVAYDDFVKEADTNKDGKVSIDEATEWLKKYIKN